MSAPLLDADADRVPSEAVPRAPAEENIGGLRSAPTRPATSSRQASSGKEASAQPTSGRTVRYRARSVSRWRFVRAYATTFEVISSYLWLFWKARVFGPSHRAHYLPELHRRNARRVYETILELQGLFILSLIHI